MIKIITRPSGNNQEGMANTVDVALGETVSLEVLKVGEGVVGVADEV